MVERIVYYSTIFASQLRSSSISLGSTLAFSRDFIVIDCAIVAKQEEKTSASSNLSHSRDVLEHRISQNLTHSLSVHPSLDPNCIAYFPIEPL